MQRVLFQKKSTPLLKEERSNMPSVRGQEWEGGRRGRKRMLPSQRSGLLAKNVSLNSSPVSAVPDPESLESLCPEACST